MVRDRILGGIAVALFAASVIVGTPTSAVGLSCAGPEPFEDLIDDDEVIGFVEREHVLRRPRLGILPGLSLSVPVREWGEPSTLGVRAETEDWGWCDASGIGDTGWHYPAAVLVDRENPAVEIDRDWDGDGSIVDSDAAVLTVRFGQPAVSDPSVDRAFAWLRLLGPPVVVWMALLFGAWVAADRRSPPPRRFDVRYLGAATALAAVLTAAYGAAGILLVGLGAAVFASWSGRGATAGLLIASVVLVPLPGVEAAWWGGPTGTLDWPVTLGWFVILALGLLVYRPRGRAATLMFFLPLAGLPLAVLGALGFSALPQRSVPAVVFVGLVAFVVVASAITAGGLPDRLRRNARRWRIIAGTGWIPIVVGTAIVVPIEMVARRMVHEPVRPFMLIGVIVTLALSFVSPSLVVVLAGAVLLQAGLGVLDGEVLQIGWEASVGRIETGLAVLVLVTVVVPIADRWWGRCAVVVAGLGAGHATSGWQALHEDYWTGDKLQILIQSIVVMLGVVVVLGAVRFFSERALVQSTGQAPDEPDGEVMAHAEG